jgi:phosphatidylinositol glycan class S
MSPPLSEGPAVERFSSLSDPSKLFFQRDYIRRSILASYWVIIIFALPLWWQTTSIERLSLPSSRVYAQAERELVFPVKVKFEVPTTVKNDSSLATQLQELLDEQILRAPHRWKGIDIHISSKGHAGGSVFIPSVHFLWIVYYLKTHSTTLTPTLSLGAEGKCL